MLLPTYYVPNHPVPGTKDTEVNKTNLNYLSIYQKS